MQDTSLSFPSDFLWGCATAALQIEGSTRSDGRENSIWDDFCEQHPERVQGAANPEPGCDHYRRWEEDLDWIERLGHNAYRFSISWPRARAGLDFYDRLVDGLCQRGVAPMATLYHWDLPARLGSWENPDAADAFADFVSLAARRLGDRVSHWMTLNEPAWSIMNGYVTGLHPPCLQDLNRALAAGHQLMRAHHLALSRLRSEGVRGQLGIALNLSPVRCAGESAKDRRAARWADDFLNRWFLEAVIHGRYPRRAARLARFREAIQDPQPIDFLGVNYYYPKWVAHSEEETRFHLNTSGQTQEKCHFSLQGRLRFVDSPAGAAKTEWDWEIDPQGLEDLLLDLHRCYPGLPLMVTENGLGLREDGVSTHDPERIAFVQAHLEAISRALKAGAPVRGYLMWSLMDNFSWLNGYQKRYGLLAVEPGSLQRRPKDSAWWFKEVFSPRPENAGP
ncbi:MAG: family 1 glycosylhydrolase [Vulcanimicrobiota bacterium]